MSIFIKCFLSLTVIFFAQGAIATPGDIGCISSAGKMSVDVLIGYDHHGELDPSLLEVSVGGKKVFTSPNVTSGIINVGSDEQPFTNGLISADEGKLWVKIRIPEQDPSSSSFEVFLTAVVKSGYAFNELLLTCQR